MADYYGLIATRLPLYDAVYEYVRGGHYRPLGLAYHARTQQEMVIYRGLDGADKGKLFACTPADWADRFTLVQEDETRERTTTV